jgi:hypothetical protein
VQCRELFRFCVEIDDGQHLALLELCPHSDPKANVGFWPKADMRPSLVNVRFQGLSAPGAIFRILEMYSPFNGMMQLDSAPLRQALAPLP